MPRTPSRPSLRQLISLTEAAGAADVSVRTLRRYLADGRLTGYRVGPRLIKVDVADVEKLIRPVTIAG